MLEVDMYKITSFTTNNIGPSNKYPFKTIATMEQCAKYA